MIACVNILIELGLCQFHQLDTGPYALWIIMILVKTVILPVSQPIYGLFRNQNDHLRNQKSAILSIS